ncbi:hypothetical protein JQ620_15750 [Bradyrhizobium sp. AUGA SZCCT0274]|uniref:hypothetical protein n=1 Tax=Bradyrhizobium sp. AUGA SZCCT0274 TaxID=2807670 RepID=UPI001BAB43FA|nr:hypothetical protein [Bradyrhizobium sp. AUGA SZCCT0274]MBR1241583.1 hypothetical protein [Bradyrhizobium sp. AUGA SZCCT0274]
MSSELDRAQQAMAAIRAQNELPPQVAVILDEILAAVRALDSRVSDLERKAHPATEQMDLPKAG